MNNTRKLVLCVGKVRGIMTHQTATTGVWPLGCRSLMVLWLCYSERGCVAIGEATLDQEGWDVY